MGNDSTEVILARLDERMSNQSKQQEQIIEQLREQANRQIAMEQRMHSVEQSLTTQKPVIDEFIVIKSKVVGAGQFGKWAWVIAASLVSFLIGSREFLAKWLNGGP